MSTSRSKGFSYSPMKAPIPPESSQDSHDEFDDFSDPYVVEQIYMNMPKQPTSEYSVNSYVSCHCGDPAPLQMAWTLKNPGRRFYGCHNFKTKNCGYFHWVDKAMKPCERVYDFYVKIQDHKGEIEKLMKVANFEEFKNFEPRKEIEKLKMQLKLEQKNNGGVGINLKWIWVIGVFVMLLVVIKFF